MSDKQTNWILNLIERVTSPMRNVKTSMDEGKTAIDHVTTSLDKEEKALTRVSAVNLQAIGSAFQQIGNDIDRLEEPGKQFEVQLKNTSAITGAVGAQLDALGESAKKTAADFGGSAAAQLESYKTIISRFGPDIARVPAAIDSMGRSVATLSKTMDNDAKGATDALTTAMLQYQVDLNDPIKASQAMANMMNVMAAGAKYGAAEVPQIGQALEQSGVQANLAKVSFEEVNSAIQAMAAGGKYGAEAGVAIRNVLTYMSSPSALSSNAVKILQAYNVNMKQAADTSLSFTDRLRVLKPIQNDINALTAVFGRENAANAQILIRSADAQENMTKQITGTQTATEQANIVMGSYEERMKRWGAWLDNIKIGFFHLTKSILPFIEVAVGAIVVFANLKAAQEGLILVKTALVSITWLQTAATGALTAAQWLLNAAFIDSPIGWVVLAIGALAAGVVYAWNKFAGFRDFLYGLWGAVKQIFTNIGNLFKAVFAPMAEVVSAIKAGNWGEAAAAFLELNPISTAQRTISFLSEGGLTKDVGKAYDTAAANGEAQYQKDHQDKKLSIDNNSSSSNNPNKPSMPAIVPPPSTGTGTGSGTSISGTGSGKSITMRLEVNNYFNNIKDNLDIRKIADQVAGQITDRLRDAAIDF